MPEGRNQKKFHQFVLVTPVFNDTRRLGEFGANMAQALASWGEDVLWVIADDGSIAKEWSATEKLAADFAKIYPATEILEFAHVGKGGTIRDAWSQYAQADWLGFVDADGSVSPAELRKLFSKTKETPDAGAILGVRDVKSPATVWHNPVRLQAHRVFARLSAKALKLDVSDTQCGAKLVSGPAFRVIEPVLREDGFIFDCELLAALNANGYRIVEEPVAWVEKSGSQVLIHRDAWQMYQGLMRVRRRLEAGELDVDRPV